MSVSMWSYRPEVCDGGGCPGDCDLCDKPKNMEDEDDMDDYIKRKDAIEAACMGCNDDFSNEPCEPSDCDITRKIMELPSADVVEVVRCKDCKYWNQETDLTYCSKKSWLGTDAEDYCSFGERAEA